VAALLLAVTIWGSTFLVTKAALREAGPFTLTALRFLVGLAIIAPLAHRGGFSFSLALRPPFLLFGLTGVALNFGLQNLGLAFTTAGNAALIQAGIPATTALLAWCALRERPGRLRLLGIALAVAGVLLVTGSRPAAGGARVLLGNALVAGSMLSFSAYAVQGKRIGAIATPTIAAAGSIAAGLLVLLPLAAGEIGLRGLPALGPRGWLATLYLGCGASALTIFLWNYALRFVDAGAAALYTNLIPVVGLAGAFWLGEPATRAQLLGGALALLGVLLGEAPRRPGHA
jgi:drug/metabolite transporter (DMT)-like permease